jgi:hypothetical protein
VNLAGLRRIFELLEREYADRADTRTIRERLLAYIDARTHRAAVVDPLPANAPAGYLMVTPGSTSLFVGAGPSRPLREIPTQPLP